MAYMHCHNDPMDPRKLTKAQDTYKAAVEKAEEAKKPRDTLFRQAKAEGARQADIVKATGLTRETVRRILDPRIAEELARKRSQKGRG